jgi:GDP-L-fucose synthase
MKRLLVLGGYGFVGKNLREYIREHHKRDFQPIFCGRTDGDLTCAAETHYMIEAIKPAYVINLAANVGGILYNENHPVDLIQDNTLIGMNVASACSKYGVEKLVQVGTVCMYPHKTPVPFKEEYLMQYGDMTESNSYYGMAKLQNMKLLQAYFKEGGLNSTFLLPANMVGKYDDFSLVDSHVVPAMIAKIHTATQKDNMKVAVWGNGQQSREFLPVKNFCQACVKSLQDIGFGPYNIGTGASTTIKDLCYALKDIMGYNGQFEFCAEALVGQQERQLDISKAQEWGYEPTQCLMDCLEETVEWHKMQTEKNYIWDQLCGLT